MNEESSRSHAICTITINGCGSRTSPSGSTTPRNYTSKIQLVDLAGSERLSQTFSRTTKETCQINKGLHALSNVIMALSPMPATAAAAQHVPYRDSKLTRVLQDALGGSARTVLIACVSAADESVNETLSTLQYAARARRIQNRPVDLATSNAAEAVQLSAVQRMQWTLLRRHLAAVGLMPLPEILMQVCSGPLLLNTSCSLQRQTAHHGLIEWLRWSASPTSSGYQLDCMHAGRPHHD